MFTNTGDVQTYMLAGKATITLTSHKTGKHFTYKISQAKDKDTGNLLPMWFVGLLTGPDNYNDYQYMGVVRASGSLTLQPTKASKITEDAPSFKGFQYLLRRIHAQEMPKDMDIQHEGACGRCGRKLTVPESITRGIGPECAGIMGLA